MRRIPPRVDAIALLFAALASPLLAQRPQIVWSDRENPIREQINNLRSLPDGERPIVTKRLAVQIRQLPASPNRIMLAQSLANLVTEGDPGPEALQEVAATLSQALSQAEHPPEEAFVILAQFVRYEHVPVTCCRLDDPRFAAAMASLEDDDRHRQSVDFTLTDLTGKRWTQRELRGSVVLFNFWATWCPPCRKEMPDLDTLYRQFGEKGLVILAISDEEAGKVKQFLAEHPVTYPILLDPGREVNDLFRVHGIPKSFVYDREGKLVAQAMDMRTMRQFLEMLAQAGLH